MYTLHSLYNMSILSRTYRFLKAHKWKVVIGCAIGLPILLILLFALRTPAPEYVTTVAKRGDLVQSVEAVGTVISDRDLQLQFATSGIVSQVYVKEGDKVRAGQRLAALRSGNLAADIASAAARLLSAEADLRARPEGGRPGENAGSEAQG